MSDLDDIYYAVSGLDSAADNLSNYAKHWSEWDRVKGMRETAKRGMEAYNRLTAKLPRAMELLAASERQHDSYVTREPEGCSCHINPPCGFCTREAEEANPSALGGQNG